MYGNTVGALVGNSNAASESASISPEKGVPCLTPASMTLKVPSAGQVNFTAGAVPQVLSADFRWSALPTSQPRRPLQARSTVLPFEKPSGLPQSPTRAPAPT